jgi:Family of unknown function (DUF6525)
MTSNANFRASGRSHATRESQFKAYDRLPPIIRQALQNAAFDWASYPIRRWFESGRFTAKECVRLIQKWDREQIRKDAKRVWGHQ